jgi:hypothetical protein
MYATWLDIHADGIAEHGGYRFSMRLPTRCVQTAHALHVAREMTFGHEHGNRALRERRCPGIPTLIDADEDGN